MIHRLIKIKILAQAVRFDVKKIITKDCPTQIKDAYHYADTNNWNHEHSFQIFSFLTVFSVGCMEHL